MRTQFKKVLSMALVLCMVLSLFPVNAFAAGTDESTETELTPAAATAEVTALTMGTKPADGTTTGNPFVQGTGGSNSFRIPAMVTLNDGTIVAAADARWNTTYDGGGLDTIVSYSKDDGASWNYTFANYLGDNGNTYNGSDSTAFIDPCLATDGETVYMLCDLYPYGVALNGSSTNNQPDNTAPSTAIGFNSNGKLLLSGDNHSSYGYYLDNGAIYSSNGTVVSGLTVDAYFNVKGTYSGTTYDTNLFFSDSPFKVVRTGYLYLTSSSDGGATWSEPTLIPNVKTSSEQVCLVGPGRGLVTGGKIIFPVYSYNGSSNSQQMGFIYSSDGGATWTRSANFTGDSWSSESAVVELSDGTLRFFYRNGNSKLYYADYTWGTGWGSAVNTGIATNSNTQISAISLTKTVDGKQVILVSCPTGSNNAGSADSSGSARLNGRIQIGLVDSENYTMTWKTPIDVTTNNSPFMYSCLTALTDSEGNQNGEVAILYENKENAWGTGDNCYYTMDFATYDLTNYVTFDKEENTDIFVETDRNTSVSVTVDSDEEGTYTGWTMTVTEAESVPTVTTKYQAYDVVITKDNGSTYTGSAEVTLPVGNLNTSNGLYGFVVEANGTITKATDGVLSEDGRSFTFTAPHFSVVGLAEEEALEDKVSPGSGTATSYVLDTDGLASGAQYLIVHKISDTSGVAINTAKGSVNVAINGNNATPEVDASAALWTITSYTSWGGSTYFYITNGEKYLYPSRSGRYNNYTYSLNVDTTQTGTSLSGSAGVYSIGTANWSSQAYVCYKDGTWDAQSSGQGLYFYKYTEGNQTWTVDPALQEQRITNLTVSNDDYTTDSWNTYQDALDAAEKKLAEVQTAEYLSQTEAETAKDELIGLVDALAKAKDDLKKSVSITVNYKAGNVTVKTETLKVAGDATSVTLPSTIVGNDSKTYEVNDTTLTLNLPGTTTYSVAVTERVGTEITIEENETTTISVELADGQTVEWSSADSSYVGVAGKYDTTANNGKGAYTNAAIISGLKVTSNPVTVTATIKDADGNVVRTEKWLVTVTTGDTTGTSTTVTLKFDIEKLQNCTLYYCINGGALVEIKKENLTLTTDNDGNTYYYLYAVINNSYTNYGHGVNISFFAAPDEGYALTYMAYTAEGSTQHQYFTISDGNPDGTGCEAWPFDSVTQSTIPTDKTDPEWKNQKDYYGKIDGVDKNSDNCFGYGWALLEGNMTIDQWKVMMSTAIALGCDGAQLFTKNTSGTQFEADLTFVAQKLPTVEKTITSITHNGTENAYSDGMKVEIGDTIKYSVVVTRYKTNATYGTITYDDEKLTDELTSNNGISNPDLGTSTTSEQTYTYPTSLTLTMDNFADVVKDGKITNTVDFSYSYSSQYSSGSLTSEASAVADITVSVPEYVIDFGLPVTIDVSNKLGGATITGGTAKYGTITANGTSFTYTPTQTLKGVDHVVLTLADNKGNYGVNIYPATSVYYEEGFATYSTDWGNTQGSKGTGTQTTSEVGAGAYGANYGYDNKYAVETTEPSNSTEASTGGNGTATLNFTGTGFDLYVNCKTNSGKLVATIWNSAGSIVKWFIVDTEATGEYGNQIGDYSYNTVVISTNDLTSGDYTLKISRVKNTEGTIYLDGFRVYGTIDVNDEVYKQDLEDNPTYIEVRDLTLTAKEVNAEGQCEQVYKEEKGEYSGNATIVFDSTAEKQFNVDDIATLLTDGPKNELFLPANASLVLKIKTDRQVQIGLKALNSEVTVEGLSDNTSSITSSTEMYYVPTLSDKDTDGYQTITITNSSSTSDSEMPILSITKLKICDDPNVTFGTVEDEDLKDALVDLGIIDEPTDPTDPEEPEEPTTPTDPVKPVEPSEPEQPVEPSEPTEPEEPETPDPKPVENPFTDVKDGQWYTNPVLWAVEKGITKGITETTFEPNTTCTRGQAVTFLWRAMGCPEPETTENPFTDVKPGEYYYKAVLWAYENGITNGTSATTFGTQDPCTRGQVVTFLWRCAGKPEAASKATFTDLKADMYYMDAVAWAVENNITDGTGGNMFSPDTSCTRAHIVTFLYRHLA